MTWPLEGSRETDEGIIISEPMDWCKSSTAIVPNKIWAYQREATNLADSVRQTDDRTHVKDSIILASYGDEPGVGGGVISGTHNAECTPKTWSESVTAEGRNVVRHTDEWWMNHKNTWGRLNYLRNMANYATPTSLQVTPSMSLSNESQTSPSANSGSPNVVPNADHALSGASETNISGLGQPDASLYQASYMGSDASGVAAQNRTEGIQQAQLFEAPITVEPLIRPVIPKTGPKIGPGEFPEPKPLPGPGPQPGPGFRTSGCEGIKICFDPKIYDKGEYSKQIKLQQDAINAKSP